jgi:hypothetical protein
VSFFDLERLGQCNPEQMLSRWEEIKGAARDELLSGHRAAAAREVFVPRCWDRAQFAAIVGVLGEGWEPRNGVEYLLLDQLALCHASFLDWMKVLAQRAAAGSLPQERDSNEQGGAEPPRLSASEAVDRAGAMADRFNRMSMRTLRALRDLRRWTPTVVVQNAA